MSRTSRQLLGDTGERKAVYFLENKGYQILTTNFRTVFGEIDIVALDGEEIVFVEVKTRITDYFGDPSLAVDAKKIDRIVNSAQLFLKQTKLTNNYRFDVISIVPGKIEHFINVTME